MTSIKQIHNTLRLTTALVCVCLAQAGTMTLRAGDNDQRGQLTSSDYKFVREAALGGTMEVDLGKIAGQKSTNPSIQQFGQRMVTDHGKAGEKLKDIATKNGATLPGQLTSGQQKEIDKLSKLSGEEFDKEYVAMMVKDHKKDLKEFQHAAKHSDNTDLKEFAETTAQVIQEHLTMIEGIQKQLGSVKTAGAQ